MQRLYRVGYNGFMYTGFGINLELKDFDPETGALDISEKESETLILSR